MTPEQRLDRVERILGTLATSGRKARSEFREKINILIDAQISNEAAWRAESNVINEQIKAVAIAQAELTKSQKLTDRALAELAKSQKQTDQALRAFINSHRKPENGNSSG